jgi:hypothetical protein
MVDFDVYRTAAIRASSADPLYRAADGHYQLKYLPAFAIAMMPFGDFDVARARALWFGLSTIWLVWLVVVSVRHLPDRRLDGSLLALVTMVLMAKFFGHELTLGQANALLGALLVTSMLALARRQTIAAGVLVGLSVFVKPYAIILLPWLVFTRRRDAVVAACLVLLAGLLLPVTVYGWHGNLALLADWYHTVTESTAPNLLDTDNISLAAMWAKWIGVGSAAMVLAACSSLAILGVAADTARRGRSRPGADYADIALLMLIVPLLSPQGWDYVLLLGTPAVVCLVDRWRDLGPAWRVATTAALGAMCLTTFDLMGRDVYVHFMMLSVVTVAALVLVIALAHLRRVQKV